MRVALYARVSTTDQQPENQLRQLRAYCERQQFTIVQEYTDLVSGTKGSAQRPAFRQMMEDAEKRKFQLLLFWSLDRFSREGAFKSIVQLQKLLQVGVAFRSLQEPYLDSLGPFGDVVISILATLAKLERDRLVDRINAGIERSRAKGVVNGRPTVDPELVRQIKQLKAEGLSDRAVAKQLEISHRTVAKYH